MLCARFDWLWSLACVVLFGHAAQGVEFVDFHVDSKLYMGNEEKPISEITTIFRSGFVYDFITDPNKKNDPETTIFDSLRGRFVVIDPQRRVWTQVSTEALKTFSAKVKLDAAARAPGHSELHVRSEVQGRNRRRRHGLQKPLDGVSPQDRSRQERPRSGAIRRVLAVERPDECPAHAENAARLFHG